MDRAERLGKESILPLLISFSIPAIVGMLVQALYNVVDRIFVGNGVGRRVWRAWRLSIPSC